MELGKCTVSAFPDGETFVKIEENVRGEDVFVVQSTCPPTNHNLMELFIMIDALRRASAWRITTVIPFYAYARQDRKDQPRVPITAKLIANLIETAAADRVLTMDLHVDQIQGFFDIPLDHLMAMPVFIDYLKRKRLKNVIVASADVGGMKDARGFAERLGAPLAVVDKRRVGASETTVENVIGEVEGKTVIIPDDIITSGSSLAQAARALKQRGAGDIYACVSHPVFSGPFTEKMAG